MNAIERPAPFFLPEIVIDRIAKTINRMAKKSFRDAKTAKQDEFYTQLSDIENELKHYKAHFQGKTVLCNCDDPLYRELQSVSAQRGDRGLYGEEDLLR